VQRLGALLAPPPPPPPPPLPSPPPPPPPPSLPPSPSLPSSSSPAEGRERGGREGGREGGKEGGREGPMSVSEFLARVAARALRRLGEGREGEREGGREGGEGLLPLLQARARTLRRNQSCLTSLLHSSRELFPPPQERVQEEAMMEWEGMAGAVMRAGREGGREGGRLGAVGREMAGMLLSLAEMDLEGVEGGGRGGGRGGGSPSRPSSPLPFSFSPPPPPPPPNPLRDEALRKKLATVLLGLSHVMMRGEGEGGGEGGGERGGWSMADVVVRLRPTVG
jgi:hypothetical protein